MKTQEEQLAFAKENQRLTDEYSRIHTELAQLKSPEDDEQIKVKLQELSIVLRDMRQLSEAYMNNKLSYEEFCEKYLYEPEFDDDMISAYLADGIDIVAIYKKARRAEYQDYLDGKHTNE